MGRSKALHSKGRTAERGPYRTSGSRYHGCMPSASRWTGLFLSYLLCVGMPWVLPWMPQLAAQAIESHADPGVIIGAKLGAGIGAFNDSGVSYAAELELGYLLPLPDPVRHALQLFAATAYTAPQLHGHSHATDARLPGDGVTHYAIDQRLLTVTVGLLGRLPLHSELLAPYLALGYRGHFIASQVHGEVDGQAFGTNTEHGYEHGFYAAVGVDVFLGPGALLAELQCGYAGSDAVVLRDTNLGSLRLLVGYRLMFGSRAQSANGAGELSAANKPASAPKPSAQAAAAADPTLEASAAATLAAQSADAQASKPLVGQIRGNIRSFKGAPLRAAVVVSPGDQRLSTSADGKFSLEVPAGHYSVHLSAPGYKPQTRDVVVDEDGITVLNVELGER